MTDIVADHLHLWPASNNFGRVRGRIHGLPHLMIQVDNQVITSVCSAAFPELQALVLS